MKERIFYFSMLLMLVLSACSNQDEPSSANEGSSRDWTYGKDQVEFYINGVEQTSVYEITVRSLRLKDCGRIDAFPWYYVTLKVKGLLPKDKVFNIQVGADIDRFEGSTIYNGIEFNVTGIYTGSPFEHYKDMGIKVYLEEK